MVEHFSIRNIGYDLKGFFPTVYSITETSCFSFMCYCNKKIRNIIIM